MSSRLFPRRKVPQAHGYNRVMDSYHKQIRRRLQSMSPKRAIAYVMSVQLPPDEAACVIECDVKRKSYCETALLLNVSPETVKRCRKRAYQKFADEERSRTI